MMHSSDSISLQFISSTARSGNPTEGSQENFFGFREISIKPFQSSKLLTDLIPPMLPLGWGSTFASAASISTCGIYQMLGGWDLFGLRYLLQKMYYGLPSHSQIAIMVQVFFIDSLDVNYANHHDRLYIRVNSNDPQLEIA